MSTLWQDVRYGLRVLAKTPGVSAVAVLALAIGIGANSAVFGIVDALLLRPLPFADPAGLVVLWETQPQVPKSPVLGGDFLDWREQSQVFEHVSAYHAEDFNLTGADAPELLKGLRASADIFDTLGVGPAIGRAFRPEDERPGGARVAVISHGLWRRRFGSDPSVLNRTLTFDGEPVTVVGVLPADFYFLEPADVWSPLALTRDASNRKIHYLKVLARLKPGVTRGQAQAEMDAIAARLQEQYPETNGEVGAQVVPLHEQLVGNLRLSLFVLMGAVAFVLLIACANVANLLLARATARQKEVAIRLALGASRTRLVRQLLTESVLLALLGGALGLLLSYWGKDILLTLDFENAAQLHGVGLNARAVAFTALAAALTGLVFGLVPALQATSPDLNLWLKEGTREGGGGGGGAGRLMGLLVVCEVALSLVLLIGTGLMIKSFLRLQQVNPGFDPRNVLTLQLSLPDKRYPEGAQQAAFYRQVIGRIGNLPGVESVGATNHLPLSGNNINGVFTIDGRAPWGQGKEPLTEFRLASPDYFKAMRIPLLKGRTLTERDDENAPPAAVINEHMALRFFPGEDPVGKRIKIGRVEDPYPWLSVVGVVGNVKHFGLNSEDRPELYVSSLQLPMPSMTLVARTAGDPAALAAAARREVLAVDPLQPVYNVNTMEHLLRESVGRPRSYTLLLGVFAGVALLLAGIGIYSVVAYSVTQRRREIGIRMALGAEPRSILKLVMGRSMGMTLLGVVAGLALSLVLTRILSSLLYGVSATDVPTFVGLPLLVCLIALPTCYVPARRATKTDPVIALRHD